MCGQQLPRCSKSVSGALMQLARRVYNNASSRVQSICEAPKPLGNTAEVLFVSVGDTDWRIPTKQITMHAPPRALAQSL